MITTSDSSFDLQDVGLYPFFFLLFLCFLVSLHPDSCVLLSSTPTPAYILPSSIPLYISIIISRIRIL
jgi:hypothetical protein